ncbi:MAG: Tyrosine-specific transport protein [Chlamydiae bacterium]|nr:Tyrosine-specific transport protein [Chlamydiota bacterium]
MTTTAASPKSNLLQAMLLVAGTSIGGGMLALPVATGISGFFPSLVVMILCWIAMTATGLMLVEVSLWMREGSHMISMSGKMLGNPGRVVSWILYLFICYASIVAYTAGGGMQIAESIKTIFGIELSRATSCFLFFFLFGMLVDFGARILGRVNSVLFFGMLGAYFLVIGAGAPEVLLENLLYNKWSTAFIGIPLILTSFSFQTMVPSLTPFLNRNPQHLRWCVIGGTTITLCVYIVWQWLVLGIVPAEGPNGLIQALNEGAIATNFISKSAQSPYVVVIAGFFAFFALVTSFLGMSLGLFDFLSDGLGIPKKGWGKAKLGLIIAAPTLFFAIYFERAFLVAMDASGGFGDTILNGIIPVMMVWVGRYRMNLPGIMGWIGSRPFLILVCLFFLISLGIEVLIHLGVLSSIYDISEINLL